jgi:hypothetical protein
MALSPEPGSGHGPRAQVLGCGDTAGGEQFTVDFVHGHAECSDKTYRAIVAACLAAMVDEVGGCLVL